MPPSLKVICLIIQGASPSSWRLPARSRCVTCTGGRPSSGSRPHRAYVIGGACVLLVQLLRKPFAYTDLWHWITDGLLALAR